MRIELSKKWKIIIFCLAATAAFALGLFLECCDTQEFTQTPVPEVSFEPSAEVDYASHYDDDGRLDINVATAEELDSLYGIGEKTAEKIIEYREVNGEFWAIEELTLVNGIGESLIERIKDDICVR